MRNEVKAYIENEPEDLQKELTKYIENTLPETEALQDYFFKITKDNIDDYIQNDETNTLKIFCESLYKRFSGGRVPNISSSLNSDSSQLCPQSRFFSDTAVS